MKTLMRTIDGKIYMVPAYEMKKIVHAGKQWKEDCLKLTGGKLGAQEEAMSFPWFLRDYAAEHLKAYEIESTPPTD